MMAPGPVRVAPRYDTPRATHPSPTAVLTNNGADIDDWSVRGSAGTPAPAAGSPPKVPTKRTARRAEEEPQMEPYDALSEPDGYAASRDAFERLVSTLSGAPARSMAHDELEGLLEQQGREFLRQLMQDHLDLRARAEEAAPRISAGRPVVPGPEGRPRTWRESNHPR